jgi:glycosyltransferase involved in cell wall biosynthesis
MGGEVVNIDRRICVIVPTYNNATTIVRVLDGVRDFVTDIYVVNDGSTDNTLSVLENIDYIKLISYNINRGKGYALRKGFEAALLDGFTHAITIDSDGQHSTEDIAVILLRQEESPDSLIVGRRNIQADGMPAKNTFANKFSNFWFWAETWQKLPDTQSGFRLYPIHKYVNTKWFTTKYEFELEALVRSQWSDIKIESVPVCVYYPPEGERISHFKPLRDFARISVLNTFLIIIAYLYVFPLRFFKYLINNKFTTILKEQLLMHNENPFKISLAIGFGVFMGITPVWGFQMLIAAFFAHVLRLNKVIVVGFSNISLPPIIPFIIYFSYKTGGVFFHNELEFNMDTMRYLKSQIMDGHFYTTLNEFGYSILQYVSGSLLLAVAAGSLVFIISYLVIGIINSAKSNKSK